jgi:uncharacterized LabA/DUF88 family protein
LGKNVAVFVDVANIFYAAKAAGVDIDYVTLLKSAGAGRDMVRAYAYTGLDPENENQRNFHDFLRRHGYKVVSKDIRKYGDGKVKANLDIELVVDMMKTARNLDIAIVVSGDGDFAPAIRAVQEMGVRVEVISFRGNTSSDLIDVADLFTDITQLARVEKGSRSGRRVAGDDADLSMTEVPDKQTEGTGSGRGVRGRGRGRGRAGEAEPTAARGRGRRAAASTNGSGAVDGGPLTPLPGERLSKTKGRTGLSDAELASAEVFTLDDVGEGAGGEGTDAGPDGDEVREEGGRRRRRRGGRGRGRGRGREEGAVAASGSAAESARYDDDEDEEIEDVPAEAPRPRSTPFGSVWDSQLGSTAAPSTRLSPLPEDEDFDEPEIPEYLIAEQRGRRGGRGQGGQGGRGGPRGGRSAYQSAIERERYGRGRTGGINRYPDVSGRGTERGSGGGRSYAPAGDRPREAARPTSSAEPWSEVPPELEAVLRAQVGQRPTPPTRPTETVPGGSLEVADAAEALVADAAGVAAPAEGDAKPKRRSTSTTRTSKAKATSAVDAEAKPKRRTTRKATAAAADDDAEAKPKRRTTRKTTAPAATGDEAAAGADAPAADDVESGAGEDAAEAKPKRRTTRRTTAKTAS